MSLIYVLFGLAIMFTDAFAGFVEPPYHYLLGGLMLAYGVFRGVRYFGLSKQQNDEDDE